ncbi:hypothetical protein BU14_2213s0001 [Porphyra umbilicalis]|uniref:Uncharacterized protein n=1 Tax=Porphyra umbilicalis TaxID=2786 RepID=A0A1X6NJN1_PORUM|nr:hypothetical protein BU14_2213s0001 [Porphyra umbilicalis]|eukprot:OSX68814.1 hypothetical protein BU14_2213s0001 [Porphyra umbilicalis]
MPAGAPPAVARQWCARPVVGRRGLTAHGRRHRCGCTRRCVSHCTGWPCGCRGGWHASQVQRLIPAMDWATILFMTKPHPEFVIWGRVLLHKPTCTMLLGSRLS